MDPTSSAPSETAVVAVLRRALPGATVATVDPVTTGFSGHHTWVVGSDHGRLLVKVWSSEANPAKQLHAALVQLLVAARGLQVPAVRLVDEHADELDGRGVTILEFLPGVDATEGVGALGPRDADEFFRSWGAFVGRLHAIEVPCFADRLTGSGPVTHASWRAAVTANLTRLRTLNTRHGTLTTAQLDDVEVAAQDLVGRVDRQVRPAIVHRDLYLANVLVHDGKFAGVVDFELAKLWDPVFDFVKLGAWVFAERPDGWPPFRDGYLEHGPPLRSFSTRLALATILECLAGLPTWRHQANTRFEDDYRAMLADARHHDATAEDQLGPATTLRRPAPWT